MRVGVVHTVGSICRCAEAIAEGLRALGHEPVLADSEEMESRASELTETCDLILDHTDTFRGRGLYRALVRMLLEARGARLVGSDASACFLADDKSAAKAKLSAAGIPTPPGIVVTPQDWALPSWLTPPLVLKPTHEHMSRGLQVARTEDEAHRETAVLWERFRQPVLVQKYIPGRELAVPLLASPEELEVLPIVEMRWATDVGVLTEDFKRMEFHSERHDAVPARLPRHLQEELDGLARQAFRALGLRDYARFDVRLSPRETFFFLEANTTPSMEPFEAFPLSARWAGMDYPTLVERILSAAKARYGFPLEERSKRVRIDLPSGPVALEVPAGVHLPPESSVELAMLLDVREGEDVLELGCGSGLLSIAAARLGARRVVATDLDPAAIAVTQVNATRNGVTDRIEVRGGSWYEALNSAEERFHVIIATPPQTPGRVPFGPKYGGPDGTSHLTKVVDAAPDLLDPEQGRLWLLAVSLANPEGLRKRLEQRFAEVSVVKETDRVFTREEYEALDRGLFDYLLALRDSRRADFRQIDDGRFAFRNLFIRAARPRAT